MLKDRDYASVVRLLDRSLAMKADDEPERGDPADDLDFCTDVLEALGQVRTLLADEISEGDPDVTTAFATDAISEIDDLISDVVALRESLSSTATRPEGYIPG